MSKIVLAFLIFGSFVVAAVLIWKGPHADDLPKTDTEDDDPWPDGPR